jgi:thymidylate synthase
MDRWDTCGQAWIGLLRHVWAKGEAGLDERGPIIEAPPYLFEIESLSGNDPVLRAYARRIPTKAPLKDSWPARLRELQGVDQLDWVVRTLRARPWSTRGWIPLTVPGDCEDEMPSLTAVAFRIVASGPRSGGLVMTATFRVQDAVTSHLTYLMLRAVQLEVAEGLGLPAGPMRVFVDVPHVYVADAEEVARVLMAVAEAA